jgi:glycosyltransferase involved in cell wall biosynthesis
LKLALVHDQLLTSGGSERVFLTIAKAFPQADIFTLAYNPATTLEGYKALGVKTIWPRGLIRSHDAFKRVFAPGTLAMERLDLRGYDLVLSSSATVAKYARRHRGNHICYCYYPTRAIWEPTTYFGEGGGVSRAIFARLLPWLRRRDLEAAQRVSRFVAISDASREAIHRYYDREADVLHCPIETERFRPRGPVHRESSFLLVSRLERWKRVEYAVEAFSRLGMPLKIVGSGPDAARLERMAGPSIEFLGSLNDDQLTLEYQRARAVIFTPELEFGLIPLEANAAGTPVIALGRRGVLETMVPASTNGRHDGRPTAVFFPDPTADALEGALLRFEGISWDTDTLIRHAGNFSEARFQDRIRRIVNEYS